jgi:hypothetical protein
MTKTQRQERREKAYEYAKRRLFDRWRSRDIKKDLMSLLGLRPSAANDAVKTARRRKARAEKGA